MGDKWFCSPGDSACMITDDGDIDVTTNINAGDTVVWQWGSGGMGTDDPHTSTHCADNFSTCGGPREWDSATANPSQTSGTFSYLFGPEDAGKTFLYRCQVHPNEMRGQVVVQATPPPAPTPTPPPAPVPSPTPSPPPGPPPSQTSSGIVPPTGSQPRTAQPSPTVVPPASDQTPTPTPTSAATPTRVPTGAPSPTPSAREGSAPDGDGGISAWWFVLIGVVAVLALVAATLFVRRYRP